MSKIDLQDIETRMCLFHFLDGYFNDNISVGNGLKVQEEIINNNIDENFKVFYSIKTVIIHMDEEYDKQYNEDDQLRHIRKDGITRKKILLTSSDNKKEIEYDLDDHVKQNNKEAYDFINTHMMGKYFISNIIHDNHATSLVLFIDSSNNINILSFNSGLGINNHESYTHNDIIYYLPYKAICLEKLEEENSLKYLNIISSYFLISSVYIDYKIIKFKIINSLKFNKDIEDITKLFNIFSFINTNIPVFNDFLSICTNYDHRFYNPNIKKIDFNNQIFDYLLKNLFKYNTFYDLLMILFNINQLIFTFDINYDFPTINDKIKDKIILHNFNENNIYILDQQNGSCQWFSYYWAIIFYYIVYNRNKEKYIELTIIIYNKFHKIINDSFTLENAKFMINHKDYYEIKNLSDILYKLNLIELNIKLVHADFLYLYELENYFTYAKIKDDNSKNYYEIINKMINLNLEPNIDELELTYIFDIYKDILNGNPFNINNTFIVFIYNLYDKHPDLFKDILLHDIENGSYFLRSRIENGQMDELRKEVNKNIESNEEIKNILKIFFRVQQNDSLDLEYNNIGWVLYINNFFKKFNFDDPVTLKKFLKFATNIILLTYILNIIQNRLVEINEFSIPEFMCLYINLTTKIINNNYFKERKTALQKASNFNKREFKKNYKSNLWKFLNEWQLNYITNIIPKYSIDNIKFNESYKYSRTIENYKKNIIFLYNNPDYIYNKYNKNEVIITNDLFILINIYDIIKKENETYHHNLIAYYGNKYYNLYKNPSKELYFILFNLQLLLEQKVGKISDNDLKYFKMMKYDIITDLVFEHSLIFVITFHELLKSNIEDKNSNEFCKFLIIHKHTIININSILNKNINKYVNCSIDIEINNFIIEDESYKIVTPNDLIYKYFDNSNIINYLFNDSKQIMYILYIDYVIKLIFYENKIKDIYYNNCKVIKHIDIIYPFNNVIPIIPLHFIYKIDENSNNFYITYLEKSKNEEILLFQTEYKHITITINSNLMYPNETKKFKDLINNTLDLNPFNVIYLNNTEYKEKKGFIKHINYLLDNKDNFLIDKLSEINYDNIDFSSIMTINNIDVKSIIDKFKCQSKKIMNTCRKFILKISESSSILDLAKIKSIIKVKKIIIIETIKCFTEYLNGVDFKILLKNYKILYDYLFNTKVLKFYDDLLLTTTSIEFYNQFKIYNEYFNTKKYNFIYNFEAIFELIKGKELLEEQMEKYIDIINKYSDTMLYPKNHKIQGGGCSGTRKPYPLHHFMMGKGKSEIMTPILSLYFSLIIKKIVYIIVPEHLETDAKNTIENLIPIFNLKNIIVISDSDIKKSFFESKFITDNDNKIMIIDEFDTIIDPMKSNYNLVTQKEISMYELYKYLRPIVENIRITNSIDILKKGNDFIPSDKESLITKDLYNIWDQINNNILIENINWGIHPKKFYAIPFRNKDIPLINSNFSSSIITVFLTLYYFLVYNNKEINNIVIICIKTLKLYTLITNEIEPPIISIEYMLLKKDCDSIFNIIFDHIFRNLSLAKYHYNTSFVDIINIDKIFKIGYSGTININYPEIISCENFIKEGLINDYDQKLNVDYALLKSEIFTSKPNIINFRLIDIFDTLGIKKYNALIDVYGLFKNYNNKDISNELSKYLSNHSIIYINFNNEKKVIINNNEEEYSELKKYNNPFIYYSQTHTIGTEINQNSYPVLLGLCIIDNKTTYTQISQAIFRLRKINIGHSINIIIINTDIEDINNDGLLTLLNNNEERNKIEKQIYLKYQSLKSDIRKILNKGIIDIEIIKENHKEKIKYYYLSENVDSNILLDIIDMKELKIINDSEHLKLIFCEINDTNNLYKLIYNLDSYQDINQEIDKQEEQDLELITLIQKQQNDVDVFNKNFLFPIKFEFYSYDNLITKFIKYDENILFLPNIFNQVNGLSFKNNESGIVFVLIEHLCYIIPGYLIYIFIDKYPVFNFNLILLNSIMYDQYIFDQIKEYNIFKIINDHIIDEKLFDNNFIYFIIYLYLYNLNSVDYSSHDYEFFEFIKSKISNNYDFIELFYGNIKFNSEDLFGKEIYLNKILKIQQNKDCLIHDRDILLNNIKEISHYEIYIEKYPDGYPDKDLYKETNEYKIGHKDGYQDAYRIKEKIVFNNNVKYTSGYNAGFKMGDKELNPNNYYSLSFENGDYENLFPEDNKKYYIYILEKYSGTDISKLKQYNETTLQQIKINILELNVQESGYKNKNKYITYNKFDISFKKYINMKEKYINIKKKYNI